MRDISSPLDGIASPFGPQRTKTLTQLLFASSEPGFTFEPWDITTLYQDRAGTTPVTAAGQSVGYRRDKSGRGNHQVAVSDAKRGVYGWMPKTGKRNLLTYTEQFDNAVWTKGSATISSTSVTSPVGDASADRLSITAAQNNLYARYTTVSGSTYTLSVYAKGNGQTLRMVTTNNAGAVLGSKTQALTDSWQRVSLTYSGSGTAEFINIHDSRSGGSASGDIDLWGAQLETGSSATAYQRVASQYDITEAGVQTCYYVQADGVDDAYVTPTITPNTDKVQVFAGVRKLSDATAQEPISFGYPVSGSFSLRTPRTATVQWINWSAGGTQLPVVDYAIAAPVTTVITGTSDISADQLVLRSNGVQVGTSSGDQGTGNYLAYPAYIYSRGGTSLPFNGLDFGHAVRFGPNLDAATIARVEALIARNTPEVTL